MSLSLNQLIRISVLPGIKSTDGTELLSTKESYFTTEMSPMYSSALVVRGIAGSYIDKVSDDAINQLILKYSQIADGIGDRCEVSSKWLMYAGEWVSLKAAITAIYNSDDFKGLAGRTLKKLGDFTIEREVSSSSNIGVGATLETLECELFKYEFAIRKCSDPAINCLGLESNENMPYLPQASRLVEKGRLDVNKPLKGREWFTIERSAKGVTGKTVLWGKVYSENIRPIR